MNTVTRTLLLGLLLSLGLNSILPARAAGKEKVVKATLLWSDSAVKPGGQTTLAVVLEITPPYHINSNQAKEPYIPTKVELSKAPPEVRSTTPIYPRAEELEVNFGGEKEKLQVFTKRAVIFIPIKLPTTAQPGDKEIEVKVDYQACNDKACLAPTDITAKAMLKIAAPGSPITKTNQEIFAQMQEADQRLNIAFFGWDFKIAPSNFALLLLIAAIGGLLLNFTPCVLPLIPIKIVGLSQAAGNRRRCFLLGLCLSAGVIAFWMALAVAVSTVSSFDGPNKLFQYPAFTISVGVIIWAMAIGMCGLFAIRLPQAVYSINPSQESLGGSFVFGIMTAILSTPCTAPFMGTALVWSATQAPTVTLITFAVIGIGMALPYLVLSAFPVLVNRMPRTGPASELIKQVMGLLMFAAGAYFLGTGLAGLLAHPPEPPTNAYWWLVSLFIALAGGWLAWRTLQLTTSAGKRLFFAGLGVALVAAAALIGFRFTQGSPIHWVYYTPERLVTAQNDKKVIVLEFTAAWCLNCHALEQAVLHNPRVVEQLNATGVAPIKIDLTGDNNVGNEKLVEEGRRTIPYLVVYSPDGQKIFASDAYTVEQLLKALKDAQSSTARASL